ncbi:DsbA family oxidoreductase [Alkalihalobacillus sp. CinArs1]|uniref:DsbA family oxidoreductase n=1 Tax=Alkalihalobacillus sp. CinArs1 TaxID=2995314 RepID=UPI0022DD5181|nr:DsbA family oxidoreductase [Alkalihalobacillus sp. CinArs1]
MKIEIWSDFVCPFCYIGKRRLETALQSFPQRDEVTVAYRSFELDPNAEKATGKGKAELLASKYNVSLEQAEGMCENMRQQAENEGLTFDFKNMKPTNSFDSHRLLQFAAKHDLMEKMAERLFYAYFTETEDISDLDTLCNLAEEVGLDRAEVNDVLSSEEFSKEVRFDESLGSQLGIQGVPFYVFNEKYAVSGAQPPEMFQQALNKAWEEDKQLQVITSEGDACGTDSCDIK